MNPVKETMPQAPSAPTRTHKPLPMFLVTSAGCAVTVLEANVTAMVLPRIASSLHAEFSSIAWVVSAFLLCFSALLLPAGVISDRIGRKRTFMLGTSGYLAASLLAGTTSSISLLLAWRALQGVAAAFLLAPALALVGSSYSEKADRDRAWAIWGGIMGLAMVLSPLIGGGLSALGDWRLSFLVNVPLCLALLAATVAFVPESRHHRSRKLHWPTIALLASGMFGMVFGLIAGQKHGWSDPRFLAGLLGGACLLLVMARLQSRLTNPMIDLALFAQRRFAGGVIAMFAYACCAQVMTSVVPQVLQNGFALGPGSCAVAMMAFALPMLLFPQVGRLMAANQPDQKVLATGLLAVSAGNAGIGLAAGAGELSWFLAGLFVIGAGGGILNGETQKVLVSGVEADRAGTASGISTTTRFIGILLGFTALSGIAAGAIRAALSGGGFPEPLADAVIAGSLAEAVSSIPSAATSAFASAGREEYLAGFGTSFLLAAAFAGAAATAVVLLMRPDHNRRV